MEFSALSYGRREPRFLGGMIITDKTERNDQLRPEYDETLLKNGIRGKYAKEYAAGTNIVRLTPDVAAAFPTEKAVNDTLRSVLTEKAENK